MTGRYGFYEAIDYTADAAAEGHAAASSLPTYMAHHQGMSLLALDNVAQRLRRCSDRFHADPRVQAADLLLQERMPHLVPLKNPPIEEGRARAARPRRVAPPVRRYATPHTLSPRAHLLSNGSLHGDGDQRRRRLQPRGSSWR